MTVDRIALLINGDDATVGGAGGIYLFIIYKPISGRYHTVLLIARTSVCTLRARISSMDSVHMHTLASIIIINNNMHTVVHLQLLGMLVHYTCERIKYELIQDIHNMHTRMFSFPIQKPPLCCIFFPGISKSP